jgi:hypothetical protein
MTPQVFIFIGPICSGKSTKAREAAAAGSIVINDDAIVAMCHGGLYGRYSKSLKHLYKSIEMSMLNSALSLGRDVVVDRPNMGRLARARFIASAKSLDASVHGVLFPNDGPEVHARRRHSAGFPRAELGALGAGRSSPPRDVGTPHDSRRF